MIDKKQIDLRDTKMAMAVHGKNNHYHPHEVVSRHWFSQAKRDGFPEVEMRKIITDTNDMLERVISIVEENLPKDSPEDISKPIFQGMRDMNRTAKNTLN